MNKKMICSTCGSKTRKQYDKYVCLNEDCYKTQPNNGYCDVIEVKDE